ncbi:uncharacterized protein Z520_12268, partial [Fonsecaea multimorphosa CBS 102226]
MSLTTTRPLIPESLNEKKRRPKTLDQLIHERLASRPKSQFVQQSSEEQKRVEEAHRNGTRFLGVSEDASRVAADIVKKQWVEQGIWRDEWTETALVPEKWKHEEPLQIEIESDWDTDSGSSLNLPPGTRRRIWKSKEARQQIAARRAVLEREREASRPYHQFVYQMSKERERIHRKEMGRGDDFSEDINSEAYKIVRQKWYTRMIWNEEWTTMPGMFWKHEQHWDRALAESGIKTDPFRPKDPDRAGPIFGLFGDGMSRPKSSIDVQ